MTDRLGEDLPENPPLGELLSPGVVVYTSSPDAKKHQSNAGDSMINLFRLGSGTFGSVYTSFGADWAIKKVKQGLSSNQLYQEAESLIEIREATVGCPGLGITCPGVLGYRTKNDTAFWDDVLCLLPSEDTSMTEAIIMERVFPLPERIRESVLDTFCPEGMKVAARDSVRNKTMIARILLGRREAPRTAPRFSFLLYNFPLTIDKLESISGFRATELAQKFGYLLARLHHVAHLDARDVELVMGSKPTKQLLTAGELGSIKSSPAGTASLGANPGIGLDFQSREVAVYLIDCNQVRSWEYSDTRLRSLVSAYWNNEPYFPRPSRKQDEYVWTAFRREYIDRSKEV